MWSMAAVPWERGKPSAIDVVDDAASALVL